MHDVINNPPDVLTRVNRPWHVHSDPRTLLQKREIFIKYTFE
jgi:hypothetical protein